jgi:hypothetical protein
LWGNESGNTALAIMPFLKSPTNSNQIGNDYFEGGFIIPYGINLADNLGLNLMTELDILRDEDNKGNHASFINSLSLSTNLTEFLGFYLEYFSEQSLEDGSGFIASIDLGLTYALSKDMQFDLGINIGTSTSAEDLNPFIGFSYRFN